MRHSGEVFHRFPLESLARSLAFAENGQVLLAGHEDGTVTAYSMVERTRVAMYAPHETFITQILATSDGFLTVARNERPKYTSRKGRDFSIALPSLVEPELLHINGDSSTVMFGNRDGGVTIVRPANVRAQHSSPH